MNILPTYKGYTVDYRLKQFRKIPLDRLPEFVDFDSEKGDELLTQMIKKNLVQKEVLVNMF